MSGLTWLLFGMPSLLSAQQIDCTWLLVDTTARVATFQLIAGGMHFNGFKNGTLTFSVPVNWKVAIAVRSEDRVTRSITVVDSVQPFPTGTVAAAFPGAVTGAAADTLRFVASKAGSYLILGRVPGQASANLWMRFHVSATAARPTISAPAAGP
jgi:sulfocyanin SoxE-like protein